MSWSLLERFIESEHFNNDPSLAVAYLSRYANHIGIQYVLCSKLRRFSYEEIEFFLPQLCHLLVSVDNDSMALEDFIIDLCQESVSGALLTFWLFQSHLHDLSSTPQSNSFKTCRRIFNKVQHIVFGATEPLQAEKIHENVLPVSVLASIVLAGVAAPFLPRDLGPLAVAQARKPRPLEDTISEAPPVQQRLARSHTVSGAIPKARKSRIQHGRAESGVPAPAANNANSGGARDREKANTKMLDNARKGPMKRGSLPYKAILNGDMPRMSTSSLPDYSGGPQPSVGPTSAIAMTRKGSGHSDTTKTHSSNVDAVSEIHLNREQRVHLLRANYFRNETQFLTALEGISSRLVILPKPARLSALRAELALIAQDLPSEVDIPLICPATLEDGSPSRSKHHRIVRINPAEATSLNSAERVPFLLMLEVLREDFDFNPDSEPNQHLLASLITEKATNKRRRFDIVSAARESVDIGEPTSNADSVFEPALGDLGSVDLLKNFADEDTLRLDANLMEGLDKRPRSEIFGHSPLTQTGPNSMLGTPRNSEGPPSRSVSPFHSKAAQSSNPRLNNTETSDLSALATHMRTAAQMLAQLDVSGSKRPRQEVEAIKARIIASMQSLEEQNFVNEDPTSHAATFEAMMAKVDTTTSLEQATRDSFQDQHLDDEIPDPNTSTGAGAARMENDSKTGGIRRGDRDDPSAATFGEEWKSKKERIRRTSPYGWMKNWDLLSVIVKTGSDLRQELFACQLIRICSKIWEDASVPVWVKQMKILVTGESSGLIETITNGVSLHSLKRSLTLSSINSGANPRKRIATLKDHFLQTFGEPESRAYQAAQDAFMRSLAGYSILSYILQLKDRHNGNILIDNSGHIIHIDFGFMLSNSPGSVGFEAAPFKLSQDYVDVLGGAGSSGFDGFKALCKQAFQALRKSADNIVSVIEMMGKESKMACFASGGPAYVTASLRQRFVLQMSQDEAEGYVEDLVAKSLGSYYTRLYDTYQYRTQGIY